MHDLANAARFLMPRRGERQRVRIAPFQFQKRSQFFQRARTSLRSRHKIKSTANACMDLCSSKNAVSFSSERTIKRLPSPRCASTIPIVRPWGSTADTQPKLQPALLSLSATISQFFIWSVPRIAYTAAPLPGISICSLQLGHFTDTPASLCSTARR